MGDGEILESYLNSKRTNKQKFADTLKMSKQNLYQLFESKKMQPETRASLEAVIGLKWDKIEQVAKEWVNIDGNAPRKNGYAKTAPDYRDEVIALLKEKISLNERKLLQMLQRNQALLNAIVETLPILVSKDKAKLLEAHEEMNKRIEHHLDALKKENI